MYGIWSLMAGRRHEILAGSFAVVLMIFILQMLAGNAGSGVEPVVVANAAPASLGTAVEQSDAPDAFARADEESESPANDAEPSEPVEPHEPVESSEPDEPTKHETPAESGVAGAVTPQPPATPVEPAPKPVDQMSPAELQQAVEAYEKWVHEGQVKLFLDYSRLPIQQLDSITVLYVARTAHSTILVSPNGSVKTLGKTEAPTGKLIGDLPLDRSKWPPVLATRARERFGSGFMADANFMLTDACAVTLYRTLAKALGNKEPRPGMEFVLRLQPKDQQIEVQLVRQK